MYHRGNQNDQKKKDKRTNNALQNTTQKTKDRATRTPLETGDEIRCSRMVGTSCSISDTRRVILVKTWISKVVHTTRFCNNPGMVLRSKSKYWKSNHSKVFGIKSIKELKQDSQNRQSFSIDWYKFS